jgi:hypothetical protein
MTQLFQWRGIFDTGKANRSPVRSVTDRVMRDIRAS